MDIETNVARDEGNTLPSAIAQLGERFSQFRTDHRQQLDDIERKVNRLSLRGLGTEARADAPPLEFMRDAKSRTLVPVLTKAHQLSDLPENQSKDITPATLGRLLRGLALGSMASDYRELEEERKALSINVDTSGGVMADGPVAAQIIDLMRSKLVLNKVGCRTIPMVSKSLTVARLAADIPTEWHGENQPLVPGDPSFAASELVARTVVASTKASLELMSDASNIEELLVTSLTGALAGEIDKAGLVGRSTNAAAAPAGLATLTGRNKVTAVGVPADYDWLVDAVGTLLNANLPLADVISGGLIVHPAVLVKCAKIATGISGDKTSLRKPQLIENLRWFDTTAAPNVSNSCMGFLGYWPHYLFGIRQQIEVRILREALMASSLSVAIVAFARVDFVPVRASSFSTIEGITTS